MLAPVPAAELPATQAVHSDLPVMSLAFPVAQAKHSVVPMLPPLYFPTGQAKQEGADVRDDLPSAQTEHEVAPPAEVAVEYVPKPHSLQEMDLGSDWNFPLAQLVQRSAFSTEYFPLEHSMQTENAA